MPLPTQPLTVLPEWIDHNGHMNVAYYVLAFDVATDAVYEDWGIGLGYTERLQQSLFTLGMNVDYLCELFAGDTIRITTQLIDVDHKRVHYFHTMYTAAGEIAATNECLAMNIDLPTRKSVPFPDEVQARLAAVHTAHSALGAPVRSGRTLAIRR